MTKQWDLRSLAEAPPTSTGKFEFLHKPSSRITVALYWPEFRLKPCDRFVGLLRGKA